MLGDELSPDSIDSAIRNAASIIPRLVEAWYLRAHSDVLPVRQPGELSYFIPQSHWRATSRGRELSLAYDDGLTALLYVHRIVINSPLLMLSSASIRGKSLEWCRDLLLTSLHLLLSLKELVEAGTVVIIGSDGNYYEPWLLDAFAEKVGQPAVNNLNHELRQRIIFSLASGCAVDVFANNDAEYGELQELLGPDRQSLLADRSEAVHLAALLEEIVPDTADLDLRQLVRIRQDDSFEQWRCDLRTATRRMIAMNSIDDLKGEGIEEVRALMEERAARIREAVARTNSMARLRTHLASFAIGGIGAVSVLPIIGQANVASEVAMLAGSLGTGSLSIGLEAVRRSLRNTQAGSDALTHHYAFVAKCARR
ncbi:hypothetical protein AB0B97_18740 [Micromonospora sp. NPDC049004]|uniref:hypothetical protein n=1 Tax=Micromonospora sp. NPDC049004 TaxID=3154348 RepID=UPI0033CED223